MVNGKRRLAGDTARAATTSEVQDLRREPMMGERTVAQEALFYSFSLERHVFQLVLLRR